VLSKHRETPLDKVDHGNISVEKEAINTVIYATLEVKF
jgi:hypothetical protein